MRALAFASMMLAGCAATDVVAVGLCARPTDCASGLCVDGVCAPADGGMSDADADAGDGGFCDGTGPLVFAGDSTGSVVCADGVAQTTFRYALCTCSALATSSTLVTDAFDSREGPYTSGQGGASVGVVGSLNAADAVSIAGALIVSGSGGVVLADGAPLTVRGDLDSGGALDGTAIAVLSDARVAGDVHASSLVVGDALTVPATRTIDVTPGPLSVGSTTRADVSVAPPCDCGATPRLDVGAFVAEQASVNDDAAIGLTPATFVGVSTDTSRALPCGRYYLDAITSTAGADVTITITGRVALFVAGDVDVDGDLRLVLASGGELDLFVAGDVAVLGALVIGDADRAARARVYVGGTESIALSGTASIAANVYAPSATLQVSGALEVFGSLFTQDLQAADAVTVHYDRAVLDLGEGCAPEPSCTSCLDCGNQACNGGACGPCLTDADCCAPLECMGGVCMIEIL